ncbi:MAG: transposase, partial [Rhodospirillaceae bacterium]|nr:transposase [Rhodospirillaceae bacterium]
MAKRRRFTASFKARVALAALREDRTLQQIAAQHSVHPNQVSHWKRQAREGLAGIFEARPSAGAQRQALVRAGPRGPRLRQQCRLLGVSRSSWYYR